MKSEHSNWLQTMPLVKSFLWCGFFTVRGTKGLKIIIWRTKFSALWLSITLPKLWLVRNKQEKRRVRKSPRPSINTSIEQRHSIVNNETIHWHHDQLNFNELESHLVGDVSNKDFKTIKALVNTYMCGNKQECNLHLQTSSQDEWTPQCPRERSELRETQ